MSLSLVSYNIHRCYGGDGLHRPERVRQVLRDVNAQVIALQEVELLHDAPQLLDYLCDGTDLTAVRGLTLTRDAGDYGNALLTSLPVESVHRIDLSFRKREPRGALQVTLRYDDFRLCVVATHLGLRAGERRAQLRRLLHALQTAAASSRAPDATVLMGDLNEWLWWARSRRWLRKVFTESRTPATFPARWPLLSLDVIVARPAGVLRDVRVINNPLARIASDHLPLVATLDVAANRHTQSPPA